MIDGYDVHGREVRQRELEPTCNLIRSLEIFITITTDPEQGLSKVKTFILQVQTRSPDVFEEVH